MLDWAIGAGLRGGHHEEMQENEGKTIKIKEEEGMAAQRKKCCRPFCLFTFWRFLLSLWVQSDQSEENRCGLVSLFYPYNFLCVRGCS